MRPALLPLIASACGSAVKYGANIEGKTNLNPFQFIQEVRQETAKVTWPTRKETWITTVAVLIMVTLASIFFMIADQIIGYAVKLLLQLAS